MRTCSAVCSLLFAAVTLSAQTSSGGGKLAGRVLDAVEKTPIAGASVTAKHLTSGLSREVITEPDGTYELTGLQAGATYEVSYSKSQYVPETRKVVVTASIEQQLIKQRASRRYWVMEADNIKSVVAGSKPDDTYIVFTVAWSDFQKRPVSPEGKAVVANQLKMSLNEHLWSSSPTFRVYAHANANEIGDAERTLMQNPEDTSVLRLDPLIIQDIKGSIQVSKR